MFLNDNLYNWTDMLKLEHINHIATEDFTLDELKAFELFLFRVGAVYGAQLDEEHKHFDRMVENYIEICKYTEANTTEDIEYLDEVFLGLKLEVEEMAGALVFDKAPWFFSEARRAAE